VCRARCHSTPLNERLGAQSSDSLLRVSDSIFFSVTITSFGASATLIPYLSPLSQHPWL
jgi:hypothetical protein